MRWTEMYSKLSSLLMFPTTAFCEVISKLESLLYIHLKSVGLRDQATAASCLKNQNNQ